MLLQQKEQNTNGAKPVRLRGIQCGQLCSTGRFRPASAGVSEAVD